MRIGIDCRMYRSSVAGIGRYSQNLIKNLLEIDHDDEFVLFMTSADAEEFKMQIANLKVKIKNYKIIQTNIAHFSLAEQVALPKILKRENLDLMHFLNFNHPVRYRGKFIVTIHDLTLYFHPETARDTNIYKTLAYKYVMKKACQNSAKIIAVSENTKKDIVNKFQIENAKIQTIYEAADDKNEGRITNYEGQIRDLKSKYKIGEVPVILTVGQFRKHKNLVGLVKAFEILRPEIPAKLALLGKADLDFELKQYIDASTSLSINPENNRRVDKSEYKEDIIMPGFVSDEELFVWYKSASVFVFPSFYEGFGLPGLEAMQAGIPVVSSNKSSLPEIYRDGAIYFNPFDVGEIADKIKEVLTNKNLRAHMIESGKKVAREYSWRKTAKETLAVYRAISDSQNF